MSECSFSEFSSKLGFVGVLVQMATGWLKGTVKAVPSGDSLLIMGSVKGGPPPEKTITLAALIAPRLVSAALIVNCSP